MAQRVITQLVSDLSGDELAEGEGRSIEFGLDGKSYRIDLTTKEAEKFAKAFEPYISVATKVTASSGRRIASSKRSGEDVGAIREWAKSNGFDVSERGRVKQEVKDAYAAAH